MIRAITQRYLAAPRAVRWAALFAIGLVGYFAVIEPLIDVSLRLGVEADRKRDQLVAYHDRLDSLSGEASDLALGQSRFGDVDMPGQPARRPGEFSAEIARILRDNDVHGQTTRDSNATLRPGPLSDVYPPNQRVGTLVREIQFTGTPEQVAKVLADLERSPVVAAVTAVELSPADDRHSRTLEADITAEAWIEPTGGTP